MQTDNIAGLANLYSEPGAHAKIVRLTVTITKQKVHGGAAWPGRTDGTAGGFVSVLSIFCLALRHNSHPGYAVLRHTLRSR